MKFMPLGGTAMKRAVILSLMILLIFPAFSRADDTEIYGTVTVSLQPNVLIVFDTSGSMSTAVAEGDPYDPSVTYPDSGYEANKVYYEEDKNWVPVMGYDIYIDNVDCQSVKNDLLTKGYDADKVNVSYIDGSYHLICGGRRKKLRLGNFINYDLSAVGNPVTRIDVAKQVISNLINQTANVRFGLFRFNTDQGGRLVSPCGTSKESLLSSIASLNASGWTPLAETMAEVGLYFAGMNSWYNTGVNYTSPMEERCQKNYVILMTDGEPTQDIDWRLTSGTYINGDNIGDYDGDGNDPGTYGSYGSDYLDDVAKYLYERDCNPSLGSGTSFEKQSIITYTIGFATDQVLLQETASNGGGLYYTANNYSALSEAFEEIMANISEENAVFVAPVVPVSRMNRTYAGDRLYLGFFKPQNSGRWLGNVKKYGLDASGDIMDKDGQPATLPDGRIKDNARSYWSLYADGPNVGAGGVGELLLDQSTRNIYAHMGTESSLTHSDNSFISGNSLITPGVLGVSTDGQRDTIISDIHGGTRFWIFGDILHSEPAVVHYSSTDTKIFVGSNDGMLHCFDNGSGDELWAYIPEDQLPRLQLLSNTDHDYFVDGSPVVYDGTSQKILFFGERRGGNRYYALDVTNYSSPSWLYSIGADALGGGEAELGQSWCKPEIFTIKTTAGSDTVFLLGGGYDTNQDAETPASTDGVGKAIFTARVTDGAISSLNVNDSNFSDMNHSIVDVSGFDRNGNGYVNRVYAGDMGGNVFAVEDDDGDGTWVARKLFSASAVDGVQKKMFYAPDAVAETYGEMIFIGTGDRADPGETGVVNRIYAIKSSWDDISTFEAIDESDLVDVTDNLIQLGTEEEKLQTAEALADAKGWYIRFENTGEKITSSPRAFAGVIYFTTYTPDAGGAVGEADPCAVAETRGSARLYALDYRTGGAVMDYSDVVETDAEGETVERGKLDRSKVVGTAIPSAPVIAIHESGPKMYLGIEGGVATEDVATSPNINLFYWRQLF